MARCTDELPLITASIAVSLAKTMTTDELNYYGSILSTIGANMVTIAAAREMPNEKSPPAPLAHAD